MDAKRNERRGMVLILFCTLLWSISGVMIKWIPWPAPAIAGVRSLLAGCVMAAYMRAAKIAFRLDRTSLLNGAIMSAMFLCFTLANKLTTAANAIVIQSSAPVFVLVYNVLFRKKPARALDVITVALTMIGITMFFLDKLSSGQLLGNAVALVSGVLLAATYIVTCGAPQATCMSGIVIAHGITALVGIPFLLSAGVQFTGAAVGGVLLLGIVQLGIPYILYALAVQHCPPLAVSLIGMSEAVFNPIWVVLFTGEAPGAVALCGAALVLCSIAFWAVRSQRRAGI